MTDKRRQRVEQPPPSIAGWEEYCVTCGGKIALPRSVYGCEGPHQNWQKQRGAYE